MKRFSFTFSALALISFFLPAYTAFAQEPLHQFILNKGEKFSKANNCAMAIGIIDEDNQQAFYFGKTNQGDGQIPDSTSVFGIGELTSLFTTALMTIEEQNGRMDLNDPADKYLPDNVRLPVYQEMKCEPVDKNSFPSDNKIHTFYYCFPDPSYHPKKIVLCDLATCTSGLPALPRNLPHRIHSENPFSNYGIDDLSEFLNSWQSSYPPGTHYHFSPLSISLLGWCISSREGQPYEDLLREKILTPLQMDGSGIFNTSIGVQVQEEKDNGALSGDFGIMNPSLGLYSNLEDMMKFLAVSMGTRSTPVTQAILSAQEPRVLITNPKKLSSSSTGLGWIISPFPGKKEMLFTWQQGNIGGYASYIGFSSKTKTGIVILSNSKSSVQELGEKILLEMIRQNTATLQTSSEK